LSKHGDYKLGDFGIARQIERALTAGTRAGSPNYMAPEVYSGKQYGATVDLYSLGLVMHRLLNNKKLPFISASSTSLSQTERDEALGKRMTGVQIPAPANASPGLSKVILKACEFNAKNRFKTASEMRIALETYKNQAAVRPLNIRQKTDSSNKSIVPAGNEPTELKKDKMLLPWNKFMNKKVVAISGGGALAIVIFLIFALYPKVRGLSYYSKAESFYADRNYAEAANWYQKSAELGYAPGQTDLGNRYYYGEGVRKDLIEAAKWYKKAAEQGDAGGQFNLGKCYYDGNGVAKNFDSAFEWYKKAADQGNASAQKALEEMYRDGLGVKKNN
ncbi:MAG: protein kinase, partial [Clostridiales bacterium]|nr:protein kinase [Clostridiales bacterium]